MRYKHIFFDLDHTLWDFETNAKETLQDLYAGYGLQQKGIPSFEEFHKAYSYHNDIMWERFRKGYITREILRWKRVWLTLLDFRIADEALTQEMSAKFLEILPTKTHLFPYTTEALDYLKGKNYPLHLITNGFEETQLRKLRHAGIESYFTCIVTSESAGSLKPHRGIFDFALQQVNASSAESIMVGDTLEVDILGAKEVGMDQVYFNPRTPAVSFQPTYTIQHLKELTDIL